MTPALQLVPPSMTVEEKIDRFGDLDCQMALMKHEHEALKDELRGWCDVAAAAEIARLQGHRWVVLFGARKKERRFINKLKAFRLVQKEIGIARLVELVTLPLREAVDRYVPESLHPKILIQEQTGTRDLKDVLPLNAPAAAKAAA